MHGNRSTSSTSAPPLKGRPAEEPRPFFRAAADGFRAAKNDAERAAKDTLPRLQSLLGEAAYDASYLAGYGAFFSLTLVREMLPERVREGFSAGAKRGQKVASSVIQPSGRDESAPAAAI
jgi:hypothetical protein